jgi:PIN domain nuclease of toxin-antitoxin system
LRLLLDTQVLLWFAAGHPRLGRAVRGAIASPANEVLVSAVSLWEAAIKVRAGKLVVEIPALTAGCVRAGFRVLELSPLHVARLMKLPLPGEHRDPFGHLLLAQASAERAQFVTADMRLEGFGVAVFSAG